MPDAPLIALDAPTAIDVSVVGGKASGLARLRAAGLPAPDGFVIPGSALEAVLAAAGLSEEARSVDPARAPGLRAAVQRVDLPDGWADRWATAAARLGPRIAVRSSARAEDGRTRSHAGRHASVVGLSPDDLPDAVRTVWASLWADEALVYRGVAPRPDEMAVLVQPLVRASCSGVMFTTNPVDGSWREILIEAAWGRGEAVVGGHVAPQGYVVRRSRSRRRPVPTIVTSVDVPDQDRWWPPDGGGEAPIPPQLRSRRALSDDDLLALARLGLRAEAALGEPLDVEWSRDADGAFVLLQARSITTAAVPPSNGEVLWTRRFLGERWSEPATPLGWSLIEPLLSTLVAYPRTKERLLGGGPQLRLVHGRPYVDATIFRRLAFKLPGAAPPRFLLELLPASESDALRRRWAVLPDLAVLASILAETYTERRWRRFAWDPLTNPERWRAWERRLDAALRGMRRPPVSTRDALRRIDTQLALAQDYVGIHVVSLLCANLAWQALEGAVSSALPGRPDLVRDLAAAPRGNATVRTNQELAALADVLGADDVERLAREAPLSAEGEGALRAFLDRHGQRAASSWEVMAPRWSSEPSRLAALLRTRRPAPTREHDARHDAAIATVLREAPITSRPWLLTLVWWTRRYVLLRENQRFAFDRLLASMRATLLDVGGRLVASGALDDAGDVAFLTWPELQEALSDDPPALRPWVERRRTAWLEDLATEPPVTLSADEGPPLGSSRRLRGVGVVAGRAHGIARVLRSPADAARLNPGDVLVAHALDPAWTPLLLTAGAAVLELGGMLSHGAVVAREYQVPMVVDVASATRLLRDGDEVTVDGRAGTVWLHP